MSFFIRSWPVFLFILFSISPKSVYAVIREVDFPHPENNTVLSNDKEVTLNSKDRIFILSEETSALNDDNTTYQLMLFLRMRNHIKQDLIHLKQNYYQL